MPIYPMFCEGCEASYDLQQRMSLPLPTKCPKCGQDCLRQDFSGHHISFYGVGDNLPLGVIAEQNMKRMGTELTQIKQGLIGPEAESKPKPKRPFWRTSDKPLKLSEVKDTTKYIMTGDKS